MPIDESPRFPTSEADLGAWWAYADRIMPVEPRLGALIACELALPADPDLAQLHAFHAAAGRRCGSRQGYVGWCLGHARSLMLFGRYADALVPAGALANAYDFMRRPVGARLESFCSAYQFPADRGHWRRLWSALPSTCTEVTLRLKVQSNVAMVDELLECLPASVRTLRLSFSSWDWKAVPAVLPRFVSDRFDVVDRGAADAVQIAAGSSGGCATRTDGSVWCWGYPGPLVAPAGAAARRDALVAAPLAGLTDVTEVRVDGTFLGYLCALHRDGGVTCGGERYRFPRAAEPGFHRVTGMSSIRALAIGQDFQCALRADRRVECWGANPEGQTGQPAPTTSPPVRVSGLADVHGTLVAGWHQTCLLGTHRAASSAGLYCWGAFRPAPTRVDSPTVPGTIVEIALSESACVRTEQNRVFCFDDSTLRTPGIMDRSRDVARNPPDLRDPVAVAVSERQACAVQGDGTVACWNGGIGPTVIRGITGARSVALAPEHHGCAMMTDDRVACWSVSREDPDVFSEAWPVSELQGARSLALEVTRGCALMPGGILRCWNDTLPDEKHPPRQMLTGVSRAVSGLAHTCALRTTGEVLCWGFNASGQLGTGTPSRERTVPVRVAFPP